MELPDESQIQLNTLDLDTRERDLFGNIISKTEIKSMDIPSV
jgi:hypothetical protein